MQKVLIITYYWPPAGGPGVQRWLKFVKYLGDFEIQPIVFVPEKPHYPLKDTSLLNEIPKSVKIVKNPIKEPYKIAALLSGKKSNKISSGIIQEYQKQSFVERLLLWVRGNFFIPDARKSWVKPSIKKLQNIIKEEDVNTIVTTGPPHSLHLIGLGLSSKLNIRWIADFRDPWTSIGYHKKLKLTTSSRKKHKYLENRVLNAADAIVVTSNTTKQEFARLTTKPITVITNGYDESAPKSTLDDNFSIAHIGSLLTERNPEQLWQAIADLVKEEKDFASKLKIRLIGNVGDKVVGSIKEFGLQAFLETMGYLTHKEVLEQQARAQILLLSEINSHETKGIIPGKLFEYLNANRPILALGPKDWEAGQMVEKHKAGYYLSQTNTSGIKKVLLKLFKLYQKGGLNCNSVDITQYHRKALTKKMVNILSWESS